MNKNRDMLEVMSDIITSTMQEKNKFTHIMQSCNMSYSQLKEYMELMIRKDLIIMTESKELGILYGHTHKGIEFRRLVIDAMEMLR